MFAKSPPFEMGFRLDRLNVIPLPVAAEDMPEGVIIRLPLSLIGEAGVDVHGPGTRTGGDDHLTDGHVYEVDKDVIRKD